MTNPASRLTKTLLLFQFHSNPVVLAPGMEPQIVVDSKDVKQNKSCLINPVSSLGDKAAASEGKAYKSNSFS